MSEVLSTARLASILKFPFEDENWFGKLAIAVVLTIINFIPILNIFSIVLFLGYSAEIIRMVAVRGEEPALPAWDDLSSYLSEGFRLLGVGVIYTLPSTLLIMVGYFSMFIPVFMMELSGVPESEAVTLMLLGYAAGFMLMGVGFLLSLVTGVFLPVAGCHVVAEEKFGAGFQIRAWWRIFKANWTGFLLAFLIIAGGGMVLYFVSYILVITVVLCCLYPVAVGVMGVYLAWVGSALFGAAYRDGLDNLPELEADLV